MQWNKLQPKSRRRPRLRLIVAAVCLALVAAPMVLVITVVESSPVIENTAVVDIASASSARRLAHQFRSALTDRRAERVSRIRMSEREINGMIALAARGMPVMAGRVNLASHSVHGAFTFRLTRKPLLGRHFYINVSGIVPSSRQGIAIERVSLGDLPVPGSVARILLESGLNRLFGADTGTEILEAVDSVAIEESGVLLGLRPVPGLRQAVERAGRREVNPVAAPKDVRAHYERLCALHERIGGIVEVPLGYYLGHVIESARERSDRSGDAAAQNRAAILALAVFLGSPRFDSVIGAVDRQTLQRCQPSRGDVVLAGRSDLRLHFVYSAALEVIGNSDVSFALGEFKELLDSRAGESGFSFRDLAADRAGVRFAQLASSDAGARKVQRMAGAIADEAAFFPSLEALPERIRREELERHGGLEGDYYHELLAKIERRIDQLPLYR